MADDQSAQPYRLIVILFYFLTLGTGRQGREQAADEAAV